MNFVEQEEIFHNIWVTFLLKLIITEIMSNILNQFPHLWTERLKSDEPEF